jgi:ribonuclease Z
VIAPELPFEINFIELTEPEQEIEICGYSLRAFHVRHNIPCYGYSIVINRGGRFFPERAEENHVPMKFWNRLQKGELIEDEGKIYTPDMVLGPERKGIKLTYCTDTRPTEAIVNNAKEADLLICEGMYGEADKDSKAKEYKHMTFREAAKIAKDADVKEMWLTHYSPSLARPQDFINEAKRIFPNAKPGKDKMTVTLEFDKDE